LVAEGRLGRVLSIEWKEALAPSHWAGYCRHPTYDRRAAVGSWLMEKCCHDLDIINWIVDAPCVRVASFGRRSHFKARPDVPEHCSEDCPIEAECIFAARKLYGDGEPDATSWAWQIQHVCVYHAGSDLVDHQTAIMEYANGVTVAFSLLPLTHFQSRYVHICGSGATLRGRSERNELRVHPYDTGEEVVHDPPVKPGGHGGADPAIVGAFLDWLDDPGRTPKTTAAEGLEAMVVACGTDLAMREHRVAELVELREVARACAAAPASGEHRADGGGNEGSR
jgi:predicted dehydrogenase